MLNVVDIFYENIYLFGNIIFLSNKKYLNSAKLERFFFFRNKQVVPSGEGYVSAYK